MAKSRTYSRRAFCKFSAGAVAFASAPSLVRAQQPTLRVAAQYGIAYLPFIVMESQKLVEKHAEKAGIPVPNVEWSSFGGGSAVNDAIISGSVDIAAAGTPGFLTIWNRSRGRGDVKGLAALNNIPIFLNTNKPNIKSIADFTSNDRIALPAVKVSYQALTLQMAAEKLWGPGNHEKLDALTVSMPHPDAQSALMSGRLEISAHFASPPFMYSELQDPKITKILSSYDVFGGPVSFNVVYASKKSYEQNQKLFTAFNAALNEAMAIIVKDHAAAAKLYIERTNSKLDPAFVQKMIGDRDTEFTTKPAGVMKTAEFMNRVGRLEKPPAALAELFHEKVDGT